MLLRSCKEIFLGRVLFNNKYRMGPLRQLRGDNTEAFMYDFSKVCKIEQFLNKTYIQKDLED